MVTPATGHIVLVPFPFSDLSQSKLRPAVVLADAGRDDWILCQVTSQPYGDARAVELRQADLEAGTLRVLSYARPGKLFTASASLMRASVARLDVAAFARLRVAVADLFQPPNASWRGASNSRFDHIFVVVRCDGLPIESKNEFLNLVSTPYAFRSEEVAEYEAQRLDSVNRGKAIYATQIARLEREKESP